MKRQTQFSIYLINKPGVLATVTGALAKAKVNVSALALMDSGEHGTLRVLCEDVAAAREVLGKTHDRWTECEVLTVELENKPGAFAAVCNRLSREHVNITYAYCTGGAPGGRTTAVFRLVDAKKGERVLSGKTVAKTAKAKAKTKAKRTVKKAPRGRV